MTNESFANPSIKISWWHRKKTTKISLQNQSLFLHQKHNQSTEIPLNTVNIPPLLKTGALWSTLTLPTTTTTLTLKGLPKEAALQFYENVLSSWYISRKPLIDSCLSSLQQWDDRTSSLLWMKTSWINAWQASTITPSDYVTDATEISSFRVLPSDDRLPPSEIG